MEGKHSKEQKTKVIFNTIRWKNLLSTGNVFTEIDLTQSPTTLIVGENGSGKSTILEALCFALFGKPFRKANKPTIINSINNKDLVVEVEFNIGNRDYMIRRGLKPNIFEIWQDGTMINQSSSVKDYQTYIEQNILKLNYRSFTQIVVLGSSSFVPFMQLPAAQRREIIEDLLDIRVFSAMNFLLKDRIAQNAIDLEKAKTQLLLAKERAEMKKGYIDTLKQDRQKLLKSLDDREQTSKSEIAQLERHKREWTAYCDGLRTSLDEFVGIPDKFKELTKLEGSFKAKLKHANTHVQFWQNNDSCPTCHQDIAGALKEEKINESEADRKKLLLALKNLRTEYDTLQRRFDDQQKLTADLSSKTQEIQGLEIRLESHRKAIDDIKQEREEQQKQNKGDIAKEEFELRQLANEAKTWLERKKHLATRREVLAAAQDLLKDGGIKTRIIRQYIPIINQLINKYLAAMDFFVNFELDENFDEKIKSRFRDEFSYANFSEGEKLRIDLALLLAWRSVARLKNSINTNIIILDEVLDASLDLDGCEAFIKLLQDLSTNTNVYVISHKGDSLLDKFSRIVKFEKTRNFSQMVDA